MKPLIATMIALAGVSSASGVVRFFFTSSTQPYGLTNPSLAFQPTQAYPPAPSIDSTYYQVSAFPPDSAWGDVPVINPYAGQFAYVWVRFVGEPNGVKIRGIHLDHQDVPTAVAHYIMNDLDGPSGQKRWDGAYTTGAVEFRQDPQILAGVQAYGIRNADGPTDGWNLYDHTTRTALLGTVRYDWAGMQTLSASVVMKVGSGSPYVVQTQVGWAHWIPEPASAWLLAGLVIAGFFRRRVVT